ncbi:MAG: hypothetical protein FWB76_00165 [Oscillospiraceae bacterium]|nr:hypothetical protein [Oscillospiraceae bacterium]
MPNHVRNRLTIIAAPARVQEILARIKFDEHGPGRIDFEKIIPMPPELHVEVGSYSHKALQFYARYVGADPQTREALIAEFEADQRLIDFGALLSDNKRKYGATDWYEWSLANWGTKWNSYGYDDDVEHDGGNVIEFETAWSCPEEVIVALSQMYPDVRFRHLWADEDTGNNVGEILYVDGEVVEYDVPITHSKEAYEMAADAWGVALSDFYDFDEGIGTYVYRGCD